MFYRCWLIEDLLFLMLYLNIQLRHPSWFLSGWGGTHRGKGKVKSKVAFVFSLVDQFLVRSLRLEKHPNKQQHLDLISSEILL